MKRKNYITWDEYFMAIASLSSQRSKDPNTQVGACIVDNKNTIASIGYNGMPRGCDDDEFPWDRKSENGDENETKYPYVVHAEANAILNHKGESLDGDTLYVTMFPCNECAKLIIQSGIKKVIFKDDKYRYMSTGIAAEKMFKSAGVEIVKWDKENYITIGI